jgi:hypothetical protein
MNKEMRTDGVPFVIRALHRGPMPNNSPQFVYLFLKYLLDLPAENMATFKAVFSPEP